MPELHFTTWGGEKPPVLLKYVASNSAFPHNMSSLNVLVLSATMAIVCSIILASALANRPRQASHVWCRNQEPSSPLLALLALMAQPAILTYLFALARSPLLFSMVYLVFFSTLGLSICVYRLSPLHPLAKIPGPKLSRLTKLYGMYIAYTGQQHIRLKNLHDEFGAIVRIGR